MTDGGSAPAWLCSFVDLAFLLLIGATLIAEGFGHEIPRGYIYFALGFSVFVEILNVRVRKRVKPVELRQAYTTGEMTGAR